MSYRDDREALHNHVAQLEQELAEARREGEEHGRDEAHARATELEAKLAGMRAEVEKMGAELHVLRGKRPAPTPAKNVIAVAVALAGVIGVVGVVGGVFFYRASSSRSVPVAQPTVTPETPARTTTSSPPPVPLAPVLEPMPPPPARRTTARWSARVTRSEGSPVAVGSTCTVDASIVTSKDNNAIVPELSVQCGAQSLYRSTDRFNGMSQSSSDPREVLGPTDDKSTFTMAYRDLGTRTGDRAQIDLDTMHRQASVFRETIPRFRVDLALPLTSTAGAPLADAEHRLRRAGKVTRVTGAAPVKEGVSCVLRALPNGKGSDCVAEVACGTTILWPSSAPVTCAYDGARPTGVATAEGPNELTLTADSLTVKGKGYSAEVTLGEP